MTTTKNFSISILFILSLLFFTSCDKIHVKKLAGNYTETVDVKQEGVFVIVKGFKVHIDSLWKGKKY